MKKKPDDEIDDALNADLLRGILGELPNSFLSFAARAFSLCLLNLPGLRKFGMDSLHYLSGMTILAFRQMHDHFIIPYTFHSQDNYRKGISIEAAMDNFRWVSWAML